MLEYYMCMNKKKAKPINVRLTEEGLKLLDYATDELGVSRTAALELAIRKAYSNDKKHGAGLWDGPDMTIPWGNNS